MAKRIDWISAGLAVALVAGYALLTRPGAGTLRTDPLHTKSVGTASQVVSRVYDVRDLIDQADAFSMTLASLHTNEQRAAVSPIDNKAAVRELLFIQGADVGPMIDGRVCVVANEATHSLIDRLLQHLRQVDSATTEVKP